MIHCPLISVPGSLDAREIERLLGLAPRMDFAQAWQAKPDSDFRPASVHIAWRPAGLLVHAELFDADIFNPCTVFNELSYLQGDVFELFLRPLPADAYYELHVTPQNQHLQLQFPSQYAMKRNNGKPLPPQWFIQDRYFTSFVRVEADRWHVAVEVPARFFGDWPLDTGDEWLMSFSRYDYVHGRKDPIYSSTSPHAVLSYHRQQEWARVRLAR